MPKQILEITDFSGGLNAYTDARDIEDQQFAQNWNAVVDHAGIIRVAGMGELHINTEPFSIANAQGGYGLFQFSSDYSSSTIDGHFNSGFKMGTLSTGASTTATLETAVDEQVSNYYLNWTLFIYDGTGKGQSRKITASSTASTPVLTVTTWDTTPDSTSKYMIYRWKPDGLWTGFTGADSNISENYITNGADEFGNPSLLASIIGQGKTNNYYIYSKRDSIGDDKTTNLGYVEYEPGAKIIPGRTYTLSFDCAALDKWYNDVAAGEKAGIADTGINSNESEVAISSSPVTLTVSGTTATDALVDGRDIYKSDGTLIGTCTSVTSGTEIILDRAEVAIPNATDLYTPGLGERVPFVTIHSTAVADTAGSIKTVGTASAGSEDLTPSGGALSGAWEADQIHVQITHSSSGGQGSGATFSIDTDGSGNPEFKYQQRGSGYVAGEVLEFTDPYDGAETCTLTVASINEVGLTLCNKNSEWQTGTSNSNYISNESVNYINNGDFAHGTVHNEWTETTADYAEDIPNDTQRYNGHVGSIKLRQVYIEDPKWLYQEVTLEPNTLYTLNFQYDAQAGSSIMCQVVDTTTGSIYDD